MQDFKTNVTFEEVISYLLEHDSNKEKLSNDDPDAYQAYTAIRQSQLKLMMRHPGAHKDMYNFDFISLIDDIMTGSRKHFHVEEIVNMNIGVIEIIRIDILRTSLLLTVEKERERLTELLGENK